MFPSPVRVRAIQQLDGASWVFVDGSEAGVLMDHIQVVSKAASGADSKSSVSDPPRLPLAELEVGWREERLLDETGDEIFIKYKGDPSALRYAFIRDYLDVKIKRMPQPK